MRGTMQVLLVLVLAQALCAAAAPGVTVKAEVASAGSGTVPGMLLEDPEQLFNVIAQGPLYQSYLQTILNSTGSVTSGGSGSGGDDSGNGDDNGNGNDDGNGDDNGFDGPGHGRASDGSPSSPNPNSLSDANIRILTDGVGWLSKPSDPYYSMPLYGSSSTPVNGRPLLTVVLTRPLPITEISMRLHYSVITNTTNVQKCLSSTFWVRRNSTSQSLNSTQFNNLRNNLQTQLSRPEPYASTAHRISWLSPADGDCRPARVYTLMQPRNAACNTIDDDDFPDPFRIKGGAKAGGKPRGLLQDDDDARQLVPVSSLDSAPVTELQLFTKVSLEKFHSNSHIFDDNFHPCSYSHNCANVKQIVAEQRRQGVLGSFLDGRALNLAQTAAPWITAVFGKDNQDPVYPIIDPTPFTNGYAGALPSSSAGALPGVAQVNARLAAYGKPGIFNYEGWPMWSNSLADWETVYKYYSLASARDIGRGVEGHAYPFLSSMRIDTTEGFSLYTECTRDKKSDLTFNEVLLRAFDTIFPRSVWGYQEYNLNNTFVKPNGVRPPVLNDHFKKCMAGPLRYMADTHRPFGFRFDISQSMAQTSPLITFGKEFPETIMIWAHAGISPEVDPKLSARTHIELLEAWLRSAPPGKRFIDLSATSGFWLRFQPARLGNIESCWIDYTTGFIDRPRDWVADCQAYMRFINQFQEYLLFGSSQVDLDYPDSLSRNINGTVIFNGPGYFQSNYTYGAALRFEIGLLYQAMQVAETLEASESSYVYDDVRDFRLKASTINNVFWNNADSLMEGVRHPKPGDKCDADYAYASKKKKNTAKAGIASVDAAAGGAAENAHDDEPRVSIAGIILDAMPHVHRDSISTAEAPTARGRRARRAGPTRTSRTQHHEGEEHKPAAEHEEAVVMKTRADKKAGTPVDVKKKDDTYEDVEPPREETYKKEPKEPKEEAYKEPKKETYKESKPKEEAPYKKKPSKHADDYKEKEKEEAYGGEGGGYESEHPCLTTGLSNAEAIAFIRSLMVIQWKELRNGAGTDAPPLDQFLPAALL